MWILNYVSANDSRVTANTWSACTPSLTFSKGSMEIKCKHSIKRNDFLLNDALSCNKIPQPNSLQDQTSIGGRWDPFKSGALELLSCIVYISFQSILHLLNHFCRTAKYLLLICTSTVRGVKTGKPMTKIHTAWHKKYSER